jgi:hypothetical protein
MKIEMVTEQPLAAVLERVRQRDIGARVRPNLDKVYAFLKDHEQLRFPGAHNVLLYRHKDDPRTDGRMHVEYAVQVRQGFERTGEVFASATPAGRIATTTHVGPYDVSATPTTPCSAGAGRIVTRSPASSGRSTATGPTTKRSSRRRCATCSRDGPAPCSIAAIGA